MGIRREPFEPGEVIFQEGGHGDWLYIVVDGQVEVPKGVPGQGDSTLRRLGPGDCFGEIALLGDHIHTATTRSLSAVNVLAVDRTRSRRFSRRCRRSACSSSGSSRTAWLRWPLITRRARSWPTTGRRSQPRSASYATVLGSAAAVWSVG